MINTRNNRAWQQNIGYVPQNIFLADDTVSANIAFGVDPKNIDHKVIENVAKVANLHEFVINELPKKYETSIGERGVRLSGGQRQRIVIARALALSPKIIICDECVSALDVSVQAQVLNLLNSLKDKFSFTFLFISHDLSVIRYMSDRVIILNKGIIEENGETDKVFQSPTMPYTKQLLKASDF